MRRSSAGQPVLLSPMAATFSLRATPCQGCYNFGVRIVALGVTANGALEMAWCGPDCARRDGWPFLSARRRGAALRADRVSA